MVQTAAGLRRVTLFHRSGCVNARTFARFGDRGEPIAAYYFSRHGRLEAYEAWDELWSICATDTRYTRTWAGTWETLDHTQIVRVIDR